MIPVSSYIKVKKYQFPPAVPVYIRKDRILNTADSGSLKNALPILIRSDPPVLKYYLIRLVLILPGQLNIMPHSEPRQKNPRIIKEGKNSGSRSCRHYYNY